MDTIDVRKTRLGIGLMRWRNESTKEQFHQHFDFAMHYGINYYETAFFYNQFQCEKITRECLAHYLRDSYELCAKMPIQSILAKSKNPSSIFDKQLKNHNAEYFDYYLVQCVSRDTWDCIHNTRLIEFLHQMKQEGRIRNLGFSFHDNEEWLTKYLDLYDWDCVQLQLNYVDWYINSHKKLYDMITTRGIPIFVMGALKGGQLSYNLPKEAIKLLHNIDPTRSIASWGMEFVASLPNVQLVLTGATEIWELQDNIKTLKNTTKSAFANTLYADLAKIYTENAYIPCTGCKYCEPYCKLRKPISEIFTSYNKLLNNYDDNIKAYYLELQMDKQRGMNSCTGCGECSRHCPQRIDVPKALLETGMYYR